MSEDIKVTDGTVLEALNNKVDLDGGNYKGSLLEEYIHNHCISEKITNCLLEVPQNIKLELADGVLTLKAGSKVPIPNGVGVFDEVTITSDISTTHTSTAGASFVYYRKATNDLVFSNVEGNITGSGTTPPSSGIYYNTSTNLVNHIENNAIKDTRSLPLGIVQRTGSISSIDQVFNGMGIIGSTYFLNKDVEGLMPNGRNEDGTLKNLEKTTDTVKTYTFSGTPTNTYEMIWLSGNAVTASSGWNEYREEENICWNTIQDKQFIGVSPVATVEVVAGKITSMKANYTFRAVDYQEHKKELDKKLDINQITNCLKEVPQNIKMELNNGLLTLKKGSIVIVPTGTIDRTSEYPVGARFLNDNLKVHHTQFVDGKFTVWAETTKDITYYEPTPTKVTDKYLLYLRIDNCQLFRRAGASQAGTSVPSGFNSVYYNLETNYCKTYYSSNSTEYYSSLPLGRVSSNTNATNNISKIDSVYNGFGEIGSFAWHDKGIKWLASDGKNEDGTLKNKEFTTKYFVGRNNTTATLDYWRIENFNNTEILMEMLVGHYFEQEDEPNATYSIWYKPSENIMRYKGNSNSSWQKRYTIPVIKSTADINKNILTFEPKQTFRAVDYNDALLKADKEEITSWSMPSAKYTDLALGESGTKYTAPTDGLFFLNFQWGTGTYLAGLVSENEDSVHLYGYQLDTKDSRSSDGYAAMSIPIQKGMVCQINYNCNGSFKVFRFVYAKGAI